MVYISLLGPVTNQVRKTDFDDHTLDLEDEASWAVLPEAYHITLRSVAPYLVENKREAYPLIIKKLAHTYYETAVHRFVHGIDLKIFNGSKIHAYDIDLTSARNIELFTYFSAPYSQHAVEGLRLDVQNLHGLRHTSKILLTIHHNMRSRSDTPDRTAAVPVDRLAFIFPGLRSLVEAGHKMSVKLGYLLRLVIKVEDLTAECWTDKINKQQDVSSQTTGNRHDCG